ncbi:DNA-3-methyladenine glycosylase [Leucobacter sp. GX0328]
MDRAFFMPHALEVAPRLLGSVLRLDSAEGTVAIRITEVEAYHGVGTPGPYDAGSHSKDRRTERNASMFGPPGHAYVYFSYGMHYAVNLVCSPEGTASGVLLRAGEVVEGAPLAFERRSVKRRATPVTPRMLARGPGNLASALGITRTEHDGLDLFAPPFTLIARDGEPPAVMSGPRVGVAGAAGGPEFPWRFWLPNESSVSAFRPGRGAVISPSSRPRDASTP